MHTYLASATLPGSHNWTMPGTRLQDERYIWEGCCEAVPALQNAEIIGRWAGLRPCRSPVRLEVEVCQVRRWLVLGICLIPIADFL